MHCSLSDKHSDVLCLRGDKPILTLAHTKFVQRPKMGSQEKSVPIYCRTAVTRFDRVDVVIVLLLVSDIS